jgi:hypothetical protein
VKRELFWVSTEAYNIPVHERISMTLTSRPKSSLNTKKEPHCEPMGWRRNHSLNETRGKMREKNDIFACLR